jgi:hypothetical protein
MNLGLSKIKTGFLSGELADADAVALTLIVRILHNKGRRSFQGERKSAVQTDFNPAIKISAYCRDLTFELPTDDLWELINHHRINGLQERIQWVLLNWKRQQIQLSITEKIPTPFEILSLQALGQRVVTVFWDESQVGSQITATKNDFQFTLHDLEHAERFLTQNYQGQIQFYQNLLKLYQSGAFQNLIKDPDFNMDLEYLMSDMNSHPQHQLQYLDAIIIKALKRFKPDSSQMLAESEDQLRKEILKQLSF